MPEFLIILISTILVNNVVLVQFLGLSPFMGVSNKLDSAMGMSLATTFVLTLSSVLNYLSFEWILKPLGIEYVRTISFILVIVVTVQITELVVKKTRPAHYRALGASLPLITVNSAVLGVALLMVKNDINSVLNAFFYGFGAAVGFSLVLVMFAAMRERIAMADVPAPFKGASIGMITAGLMSLAFMGFSGLIKL